MKTKTFLLLCLLSGIGLTWLSAQPVVEGTKSIILCVDGYPYWQPIYCNGEQIDYFTGTTSIHQVLHYVNGVPVFAINNVKGEATGENSDEVFTVKENGLNNIVGQGISTWHFNLIGNQGSHYIGTMTWDWMNDPLGEHLIVDKAICVENRKK